MVFLRWVYRYCLKSSSYKSFTPHPDLQISKHTALGIGYLFPLFRFVKHFSTMVWKPEVQKYSLGYDLMAAEVDDSQKQPIILLTVIYLMMMLWDWLVSFGNLSTICYLVSKPDYYSYPPDIYCKPISLWSFVANYYWKYNLKNKLPVHFFPWHPTKYPIWMACFSLHNTPTA